MSGSSTPTRIPGHRRGRAVDAAIHTAVLQLIAKTGTLAIKVEDVADAAGVNKTTIYRRFPDRDDMVLASLLDLADTQVEMPDTGSLHGDLGAMCVRVRDAISTPLGRAVIAAALDRSADELRHDFWDARLAAAMVLLDRAVERGECLPFDRPRQFIENLVAPIHFRVHQLNSTVSDDDIEWLVDSQFRSAVRLP